MPATTDPSTWNPKFLCASIKGPIILSDGRVTTCTLDHEGQNEVGNIYEHDFDTIVQRYGETRLKAMADPSCKPMCYKCYTKLPGWKDRKVPRAEWINKGANFADKESFLKVFDPRAIRINLELSSKCNLKCIGCSVARPEFKNARNGPLLDFEKFKNWVGRNGDRISHVRLYHMGETWLHPQWFEFCNFLKTENPRISLFTSTNGMPMKAGETTKKAVEAQIDHIMFSIHGATQASTERYMGSAFKLETALAMAKEVSILRGNRSKPYISWKYLIFSWNDSDEEIAEAKRLCDENGFDEINFSITSQPSPSHRFAKGTEAWDALKKECATLWQRGGDYNNAAPMTALYPGRRQREYHARLAGTSAVLTTETPQETPLQKGISAASQGRPAEAIDLLQRARADCAQLPANALFRLGESHLAMHQFESALGFLDEAISLQKGEASEFLLLAKARALRGLERWADAHLAYESAVQRRLQEGDRAYGEDIYLELSAALEKLGNKEGAKNACRIWKETYYIIHNKQPLSVYCPIPKNACSYLKAAFVQNSWLAKEFKTSKQSVHEFLRDPRNNCRLRNASFLTHAKYFRFLVLRSPFDRIASAFSNLMVRPLKWHALPDPSVRSAVIEIQRKKGERPDAARSATFEEIVRYVARTDDFALDYHFRPQSSFYDSLDDFNYIGRFEEMDGVRKVLTEKLKWSFEEVGEFNRTAYSGSEEPGVYHRATPQLLQKTGVYPRTATLFTEELRELVQERFKADLDNYEKAFGTRPDVELGATARVVQGFNARVETEPLYPTGGALAYRTESSDLVTPEMYEAALLHAFERQKAGESVRIVLAPGIYRSSLSIRPADSSGNVVIEAEQPGTAIIRGSDVWTNWRAHDGFWITDWPADWGLGNAPDTYGDPYLATPDLMRRREMIFVDGTLLRQVLQQESLEPATFWIDTVGGLAWICPSRTAELHKSVIEVGLRSTLLEISGRQNIVIKGLRFEHDASFFFTPQRGALQLTNCRNVVVEDCAFDWNNNKGLQITGADSAGIILRRTTANHNGCLGILASRVQGLLLEDCETSYNNWRGAWAGKYRGSPCGIKIMYGREVRLLRHKSLRNQATGIWFDEDNRNVTLQDCTIYGNYRGLHIEACGGPVLVEKCTISANREEPVGSEFRWCFGSGVVVTHAADVTLRSNFIADNDTAQIGVRDDRETRIIADSTTGQKQVWRALRLTLEKNTIIAGGTKNQLVLIPTATFDQGVFLSSLKASGNHYASSGRDAFRAGSFRADARGKMTFQQWKDFTRQDEGSRYEQL